MISIIEYGAGNLASIHNAIALLGYSANIVSFADALPSTTTTIVLPGVGDGSFMMQQLHERDFVSLLTEWAKKDNPLLGVCVGAQVLLSHTEEGNSNCLNIIEGNCKSFKNHIDTDNPELAQLKIPLIGWNEVNHRAHIPLFTNLPQNSTMYFVNSYYLDTVDQADALAHTQYGIRFSSVIGRGNVVGAQFHPEKSGKYGLKFIDNFLHLYGKEKKSC